MSLRTMSLQDLNPHILCVLCGGYLVDATTIIECLHSFCRSCIVKYLETSYHCPICDVEVHKTKPLLHIRPDRTLQDIVYKIVPGIYHEELNRRKEFEAKLIEERPLSDTATDKDFNKKELFPSPCEESVCITLEYFRKTKNRLEKEVFPTRYLRCSSAVTVRVLTKFLVMKFAIPDTHETEIIRCDEILDGHLTMKEVSRMYGLYAKPFVDLQYVFLEKADTKTPAEIPKSLEPKIKQIKKRRSKNLLKRCLVPRAPRPPQVTVENMVSIPPHYSENSNKNLVKSSPTHPSENEQNGKLEPNPLHPCENVKKEELVTSNFPVCDKSLKNLQLTNVGPGHSEQCQNVQKPSVILSTTDLMDDGHVSGNKSARATVSCSTLIHVNHMHEYGDHPTEVKITHAQTNGFDGLLLAAPVPLWLDHAPSEQRNASKEIDATSFTNELFINHTVEFVDHAPCLEPFHRPLTVSQLMES